MKTVYDLDEQLDLYYDKEHEKKIQKTIAKHQPLIKKTIKGVLTVCNKAIDILLCSFLLANFIPVGEIKSQEEINNSINMLEADSSYYSLFSVNTETMLKVDLPNVYSPFVAPFLTKRIDVVVDESEHTEASINAIKDALTEYNSILKAMNKEYYFNYATSTEFGVYNIKVKNVNFKYKNMKGLNTSPTLLNCYRINPTIRITDEYKHNYTIYREVFTHEFLHTFGIGDRYLAKSAATSVMNNSLNDSVHTLTANDIKYLFATLYTVKTEEDVEYVNNYIDYHLKTYSDSFTFDDNIEELEQ